MAKNAKLINRRIGKRAAYRFSIIEVQRETRVYLMTCALARRNAFGNALWKCTHRSYIDSATLHARELGYSLESRASKFAEFTPAPRYVELKLLPSF